jgi:uncharacterized protein YjbI with pentapeptide repeats
MRWGLSASGRVGRRVVACDLSGSDLSGSRHTGSAFTDGRLEGARLSTATFIAGKRTGSERTDITTMGLVIRNGDRSYASLSGQDLTSANLPGTLLAEARIEGVQLDLSGAVRFAESLGAHVS